MRAGTRGHLIMGALALSMLASIPARAGAQRRPNHATVEVTAGITLSVGQRESIRSYYLAHPQKGVKPLPPGIRKKLARGKPLPPGIAKQVAPEGLVRLVAVPPGYRLEEVGVDVLLVEVATGIVHDILMDVVH
ncbi:MAG: anti-virulence regulator CigR family protein [Gemmatimonadetes bacterium]|nr:anti-virulence regulator CigR family protein [Gemmatimonadota bacterium]